MSQPDESRKVPPWKWPLEWARDEHFWRDVCSRALAGLAVVGIGFLAARAAGLFKEIPWLTVWQAILGSAATAAILFATIPAVVGIIHSLANIRGHKAKISDTKARIAERRREIEELEAQLRQRNDDTRRN